MICKFEHEETGGRDIACSSAPVHGCDGDEVKTPLKQINIIEVNNEGTTVHQGNPDERGGKELTLKDQKAMAL